MNVSMYGKTCAIVSAFLYISNIFIIMFHTGSYIKQCAEFKILTFIIQHLNLFVPASWLHFKFLNCVRMQINIKEIILIAVLSKTVQMKTGIFRMNPFICT
jgi:hypothetical protein